MRKAELARRLAACESRLAAADAGRDDTMRRAARLEHALDSLPQAVVVYDADGAVTNLLENAVKYSDAGGSVDVSVRAEGAWVEVVVRDAGIGIPARDLDRIFERFYRVDQGRSRDTGGTGLGLAIVRHVALNHGGEVVVESREGVGSTFALRLPAAPS